MMISTVNEFVEHLMKCPELADCEAPRLGRWSDAGNTIGVLALRLNLLSVEQINEIAESQEGRPDRAPSFQERKDNGELFGQIAVELGYLSVQEVERLLEVQALNRQLELGEQLVVTGKIDLRTLVGQLNEFMSL